MKLKVQFIKDEESNAIEDFRRFSKEDIGYVYRYKEDPGSSKPFVIVTNNNVRLVEHYYIKTISNFKYYKLLIWNKFRKIIPKPPEVNDDALRFIND